MANKITIKTTSEKTGKELSGYNRLLVDDKLIGVCSKKAHIDGSYWVQFKGVFAHSKGFANKLSSFFPFGGSGYAGTLIMHRSDFQKWIETGELEVPQPDARSWEDFETQKVTAAPSAAPTEIRSRINELEAEIARLQQELILAEQREAEAAPVTTMTAIDKALALSAQGWTKEEVMALLKI